MPLLQTMIVDDVPPKFRGRSFPAPNAPGPPANADAEELPALVAEGITGPIRIVSISGIGRLIQGVPVQWQVRFYCTAAGR